MKFLCAYGGCRVSLKDYSKRYCPECEKKDAAEWAWSERSRAHVIKISGEEDEGASPKSKKHRKIAYGGKELPCGGNRRQMNAGKGTLDPVPGYSGACKPTKGDKKQSMTIGLDLHKLLHRAVGDTDRSASWIFRASIMCYADSELWMGPIDEDVKKDAALRQIVFIMTPDFESVYQDLRDVTGVHGSWIVRAALRHYFSLLYPAQRDALETSDTAAE